MNLSPVIEIIMTLAAREAVMNDFKDIEFEHVLLALLKFSELDATDFRDVVPDSKALRSVAEELPAVRAAIERGEMNSTLLRRRIRKALGNGGHRYEGDVLHRSRRCRRLFADAETLALRERAEHVSAIHFLRAALENPTDLVRGMISGEWHIDAPDGGQPLAPILEREGFEQRDLNALVREGRIQPLETRTAQALAMARHLKHVHGEPVLLLARKPSVVRECVDTLAHEWLRRKPTPTPAGQRPWRLLDITDVQVQDVTGAGEETVADPDLLRQLVAESARREVDVLILSAAALAGSGTGILDAVGALREAMLDLERTVRVMIYVPAVLYAALVKQGQEGIVRFRQIWLPTSPTTRVPEILPPFPQDFGPAPMNSPFFTQRAAALERCLLDLAPEDGGERQVSLWHFIRAALHLNELGSPLAQFLGLSRESLQDAARLLPEARWDKKMLNIPLDEQAGRLIEQAAELARERPDNVQPGLVDVLHVAGALALAPEAVSQLKVPAAARDDVLDMIEEAYCRHLTSAGMGTLTETLVDLRRRLQGEVFGQDHAIQAFVEGLFSAEVVAPADTTRRGPKAVFVFAGPPGVGKTLLAEKGAEALGRPVKRFDMTAYSDHQAGTALIGVHPSYRGAHPGLLTEFVENHPDAFLIFDEIERAHLNTVQLFLQVLDAGVLEDKFSEQNVVFRDTIIVFTTNAGSALYDRPNVTGVQMSHSGFHRQTILDALQQERDPRTGQPVFPQALCSRLATGYPLMFNRLGVNELEQIAAAEMNRLAGLLEKQYYKAIEYGPMVPMALVLREGAQSDARTVRSQVEAFVKSEIFKFCQLYRPERLDAILEGVDRIVFDLDSENPIPDEVTTLLEPRAKAKVLAVVDKTVGGLWSQYIDMVDWKWAQDEPDVMTVLAGEDIDLVLLDLWVGKSGAMFDEPASAEMTIYQFDQVPPAARGVAQVQEILRSIHEKHPEMPCFLVARATGDNGGAEMDQESFQACMRAGGARGVVATRFWSTAAYDWQAAAAEFGVRLDDTARRIYRERKAQELRAERKTLSFDSAPRVSTHERSINMRLRNLKLTRAFASGDVSEVLQDVERPTIKFSDVYGADAAKAELGFIVNWLRDPRRYRAMGLRPPRGILLYGHPGTGKTMLARALAGECNVAFLVATATNFVTIWQGSGPQNVRNLFDRARRYAPAVVFIDELDAIGKQRIGAAGANAAAEQTLNALLTEMDGFNTPASRPVIVLGATNLMEVLDEALRRRFDREIEVDKPDRAARSAYLQRRLQGTGGRQVSSPVVERLAGQSAGMTIAELERVVDTAGRMASAGAGVITDEIAEEAFERMRMGEAKGETDRETLLRIARHEAGHCLIGWLHGEKPVQISIVARGHAGGFVEREADENRMHYTKADLEARIRQAMGGRAAEMLYYGNDEGLTTGVAADLKAATRYAELMVREYGMGDGIGQVAIDPRRLSDGPLAIQVMQAVEKIIASQLERAGNELQTRRDLLDRLVEALIEKNRLTLAELEDILPKVLGA